MDIQSVVTIITSLPFAKALGSDDFWKQSVPKLCVPVVNQVAYCYDWDFLIREDTSHTTTSGVSEYVLKGAEVNLYDIVNIRIGNTVLKKYRTLDGHDLLDEGVTFGGVKAWFQSGIGPGNFPKVRLMDTPGATETLTVTYRRLSMNAADLPEHFSHIVALGVLAMVEPKYTSMFEAAKREKISRHKLGGKDTSVVQLDPHIVRTNNTIANLYGVG